MDRLNGPWFETEAGLMKLDLSRLSLDRLPQSTGRRPGYLSSIVSFYWAGLRRPLGQGKVLSQGPLDGPWGCFLDFSNPNMFVYEFITSHINFIQNEHIKLYKRCLDKRGRYKANTSNIMDVLGSLTSKLHET